MKGTKQIYQPSIETKREYIKELFTNNADILLTVYSNPPAMYPAKEPPKVCDNIPAKIVGVYPYIFRVQDLSKSLPAFYTFRFNDIIIGMVEIKTNI